MEYMIFDTEQIALNAESAIETIGQLPIVGIRISDGEPQPTKQKTEKWGIPRQRLDNKWVLARLPLYFRVACAEHEALFDANYPHIIEEFSDDWFSEVADGDVDGILRVDV